MHKILFVNVLNLSIPSYLNTYMYFLRDLYPWKSGLRCIYNSGYNFNRRANLLCPVGGSIAPDALYGFSDRKQEIGSSLSMRTANSERHERNVVR